MGPLTLMKWAFLTLSKNVFEPKPGWHFFICDIFVCTSECALVAWIQVVCEFVPECTAFFPPLSSHPTTCVPHHTVRQNLHSILASATLHQRGNNRNLSIQTSRYKSWRSESEQSQYPSLPSEATDRDVRCFQLTSSVLDQLMQEFARLSIPAFSFYAHIVYIRVILCTYCTLNAWISQACRLWWNSL